MTTIDTTRPNISRIYDYMLGGHHNFEVDRVMAQQILKVFPSYPIWARMNRWYLQMVGQQWSAQGFTRILDLGSGMPTQDHFHQVVPQARVLYSDNDPIAVAYAQEVISGEERVRYVESDVRAISSLLEVADQHFGSERRIAIGFIGLAYFFDHETLADLARALHRWAAPGSVMAITFVDTTATPEEQEIVQAALGKVGARVVPRSPAALAEQVAPWQMGEVRPLNEWLGIERQIDPADLLGNTAQMYGTILTHQG